MPQQSWFHYRAFGLSLQSSLPLPELREASAEEGDGPADVVVTHGTALCPTMHASEVVSGVFAGPDVFWMDVPDVARLLVHGGREMIVHIYPGARDGDVRAYLLGSAIGALLHLRGFLPLHASAMEVNGRAVVFIAPSGGGKSTMAMHLQHLGHRVICDDICAIELVDGHARLWPGLRNLKLWRTSLEAIAATTDGLEPVLANLDKYRYPIAAPADDRPFDLAAVVMLEWGPAAALTRLSGAAAVGALIANTFRGQLVAPMNRQAAHWRQCLATFHAAGVQLLTRPRALDRLDAASALILESQPPE